MIQNFISQLTQIAQANITNENFGPEELASKMGMSHSTLHRKLKEYSNQTISQFIREIRLKKAKEILLNEEITVSEIAYKVGFGSATYFNKCFHEYFGVAPGEFKKKEQEKANIIINESETKRTGKLFRIIISTLIIGLSLLFILNELAISRF